MINSSWFKQIKIIKCWSKSNLTNRIRQFKKIDANSNAADATDNVESMFFLKILENK